MMHALRADIGDFTGETKADDKHRRYRLVQVSDSLDSINVNTELLRRLNIDLYRPLIRILKPVPRKKLSRAQRNLVFKPMREKIEPFFPGYAFVTFDEEDDRWREIFKMAHIRGLVCANNQPVEVPWQMIEEIRKREFEGAVPAETKLMELPYILGETVRIANGAFRSFNGIVTHLPDVKGTVEDLANLTLDELDESYRVELLVDIFGRASPVTLSLADIDKL